MPVLSNSDLDKALTTLPDWRFEVGEIRRDFSFADFGESISFVNSVAALSERAGHHPDIDIRYNKVRLGLSSHDAGGITEKDVALAAEIATLL
jgi:4a-hydroxytetrahydrobiopterin dehydratase